MKSKFLFFAVAAASMFAASVPVFAQQSQWKSNCKGWVMRKAPEGGRYERFFAIGVWNIPGYTMNAMESDPELYRRSAREYQQKSDIYNLIYLSSGKDKDPRGRIEVTGSIGFYYALKEYQASLEGLPEGKDRDYAARQYIKRNVDAPQFEATLDRTIDDIIAQSGATDHIWAPIDEIVNGGAGSGWCWHPEVGEKIRERIRSREKHTLVFTDLVGISRGNSYLFERAYLKSHPSMPALPPYEALGADANIMPERPMLGFVQAYDGSPVYVNGTANYTEYDLPTLKRLFYENLKICAHDYRLCGDVFGINSFIDCNTYPVLAGVAVDGIKAGIGDDVPVWIFFDGNGYAKPSNVSAEAFAQNLKCQIYTAIVHGATGVMFWNDRSNTPEVFDALEPVVRELTANVLVVRMATERVQLDGAVHYMVKRDGRTRYLIAVNPDPRESAEIDTEGVKRTLKPYEVVIEKLNR